MSYYKHVGLDYAFSETEYRKSTVSLFFFEKDDVYLSTMNIEQRLVCKEYGAISNWAESNAQEKYS